MSALWRHLSRCLIAGIVALLPIAGLVLSIVYMEYSLARVWLRDQPYYFPGLGIVLTLVGVYLIGLVISTFLGQLLWRQIDKLLGRLPVLGQVYRTLQQILGYGEGPGALFEKVVLVPGKDTGSWEVGLVTATQNEQLTVFVPGAPNPLAGRMILLPAAATKPVPLSVNEAMRILVAVGKTSDNRVLTASAAN